MGSMVFDRDLPVHPASYGTRSLYRPPVLADRLGTVGLVETVDVTYGEAASLDGGLGQPGSGHRNIALPDRSGTKEVSLSPRIRY